MSSDLPLPFQNNRLSPSFSLLADQCDTRAFVFPRYGSFGNSGRNILEGPGYATVDLSLVRDTRISEEATIQFRAEFFNLLNRPNLHLPDLFLGSPTFGRILSAGEPRHIQLGLKLLF